MGVFASYSGGYWVCQTKELWDFGLGWTPCEAYKSWCENHSAKTARGQ